MTQIWARMITKHRIVRSETEDLAGDLPEDLTATLSAICARLDIPRPLWLAKHDRDWAQFGQTAFLKDHFVEAVVFDKLEIEKIDMENRKKSKDPRNG